MTREHTRYSEVVADEMEDMEQIAWDEDDLI